MSVERTLYKVVPVLSMELLYYDITYLVEYATMVALIRTA